MIFEIISDIDSDTVKNFATFLNENKPKKKSKIEILLNSNGGETEHSSAIIHMINERKGKIKITAYGRIYSAAFELYVLAKCEKKILPDTMGMYHRATTEINMTSGGNPKTSGDAAILKSLLADEKITKKVCKLANISNKAKAAIFADEDVYFTYEELKEMLM